MATVVEDRLKIAPLEVSVIKGAVGTFAKVFGFVENESLFFTTTTSDMMEAWRAKNKNSGGGRIKFPVAFGSITEVRANRQGYSRSMGRHGIPLLVDSKGERVMMAKVVCVDYTLKFRVLYQNTYEALEYASTLLGASERHLLNFSLTFYNTPFDIAVDIPEELSFAPREISVDEQINAFELEIQVVVKGYGIAKDPDSVYEIPIVRQVIVSTDEVIPSEYATSVTTVEEGENVNNY